MKIEKARNLACPVDGMRLECRETQLVCENGHTFDIARRGYVNLLLVQQKRSKQPGDSDEMVAARTHFLNSDVYAPIAGKLAELTALGLAGGKDCCVMDAGCGEGYYLDYVFNRLKDQDSCAAVSFIGLDISKAAIIEAAKRNKRIRWVVGTNRQPPVCDASVDIVVCVFGFQNPAGFSKIVKPGGRIILVEPGPNHLLELRKVIYSEVKKNQPTDLTGFTEMGFSLLNDEHVQFKTGALKRAQIKNLLLMTPHFFRASKAGREAADGIEELDVSVDVVFRTLLKDA